MVTTGARGDESGEAAGAGAGGDSDTMLRPAPSLSLLPPMSAGGKQNMSQPAKYKQSHTLQSSAAI